ncbi:MAG: PQQ-dependent sugar dehydrogenase [Candidatus Binatia bacterium]
MKVFYLFFAVGIFSALPAFAAPALKDPSLKVEEVVSGLTQPTTMAFIGNNDILVLQKNNGRVRRVIGGVLQAGDVLDVDVSNDSERGLLGIAVHPNFATNSFVYLYYTESGTGSDGGAPAGNRVYRYTWNGSALTSRFLIAALPVNPGPNHDGGVITFGPDGKLYVIIGDLNRNGQLQNFSNGPPDNTSVILRLDDDGSVPADNPFFSLGAPVDKYYAYGIRNSFGMAFDHVTDKLWKTENGPDEYDEINLVEPGFNSGWEKIMGPDRRGPHGVASLFLLAGSHYADPMFSWRKTVGVTGIVFLDTDQLGPKYENDALVGDVNNGILYHFEPNPARDGFIFTKPALLDYVGDNAGELSELVLGNGFGGITDLKVGPDGLLYVVSIGAGKIYRISRAATPLFIGAVSLPLGEAAAAYRADLGIGGGTAPYTVTLIGGAVPAGLTTNPLGIGGVPTEPGKFAFTLEVTDDVGAVSSRQFTLQVLNALDIVTTALKLGKAGRFYKKPLKAAGGRMPYTWSLVSGALPAGLVLGTGGVIRGTPTASATVDLTFQVADPVGGVEQKTLTLTINP